MVKIVKFGGSSLADAHQFKKVGDIIKSDPDRRFVVPSAPGKRFKDDIKVTDLLYKAYNAESEQEFECTFDTIKDRYQSIIDELNLTVDLTEEFEVIKKNFQNQIREEYAASRGEYLNGILLANYSVSYTHLDEYKRQHHHHDHDHECGCGHHHHHADEVFNSIGFDTVKKYNEVELSDILNKLCNDDNVLRAKGFVDSGNEDWWYFDLVPGEFEIRLGKPIYTGQVCVIGKDLDENTIKELFLG